MRIIVFKETWLSSIIPHIITNSTYLILMSFLTSVFGIFGFTIGIPIGLILGFFVFIYSEPAHEEYPPARPLVETSSIVLLDLLPDIPFWIKNPDYERVDWFNRLLSYMWHLDKAICDIIESCAQPIFADYVGTVPGLYRIQKTITNQVSSMYHWPQALEIPILDASTVSVKKPVGLLHVNIIRAQKLLRKDLLGTSDPYVKLSLTGEKLPAKKTTIKKRNLNPEWNEHFKLIVKDPFTQVLQLEVFDWDKVSASHSTPFITHKHFICTRLGMQMIPLQRIKPGEKKVFNLDLIKNSNVAMDSRDKKQRGRLELDLRYVPFREESLTSINDDQDEHEGNESRDEKSSEYDHFLSHAGLLSVAILSANDVEGKKRHLNPCAIVLFRGEIKRTKTLEKTRDPRWNEEFQFTLEEPPLNESIRVEVMSKGTGFHFRSKEELGHVDINLGEVVANGRINKKYHLINSRDGVIHIEISWTTS